MRSWRFAAAMVALGAAVLACATGPAEPGRTRQLGDNPPASGSLADVAWLAGNWQGEAFGERFEEVWNAPSNGSMVGMFKLLKDDGVAFYELMVLAEENGSLTLKVKHFHADFTAWEDKADMVRFRLVALEPDAVHFSGLSFYRLDDEHMDAYLAMRRADGTVREERLTFRRN